ncbi:Dihydropteroate synthase-like protein [Zopfochytrium polystomum]|nr:Dihydropteroate synthase-like protein [Zopfochytrium polystomum]
MADKILIQDLQVRNMIGVDSWERSKRQPLSISIALYTDISPAAGRGDLLSGTINYGATTKAVTEFAESSSYRSIEALAVGIARVCVLKCGAPLVSVNVEKPRGLLHAACAGVHISRSRLDIEELDRINAARSEPKGETTTTTTTTIAAKDDAVSGKDEIYVRELVINAIIGVNTWERIERQRIVVDLTVFLSFDPQVIIGDRVPKMHNYRRMTRLVTEFVEKSSFKTVEALATHIAELVITVCHAPKVTVKIRKPSALIFAESAGVEITRDRSAFPTAAQKSVQQTGTHTVILALGSNLGDRVKNIEFGLKELRSGCSLLDTSFLYETRPMYVLDQPNFLNAVCKVSTSLAPEALLHLLKDIEARCGRDMNGTRNGPRPLDLDIVFYDSAEINTATLQIPHPRLAEREFVLRPLCDISPNFEHPSLFKTCSQLLALLLHSESYAKEPMLRVGPLRSQVVIWNSRTLVMGILNVTPDSFSDGGQFNSVESAVAHARQMLEDGVDIIDVGGQSTRPNAVEVSEEEELGRVIPVIKAIRAAGIETPISVDTYRSGVARASILAGADMINDVTGGTYDPQMCATMAELSVPVCVMHMRGTPQTMTGLTQYADVVGEIQTVLASHVARCIELGVYRWNIVVDPGIGFAKTADQSYELIRDLRRLTEPAGPLAGLPVLVGPSRKRFLADGQVDPKERVWATAAACTASVSGGASILRVHDVREMRDVVRVADRLFRAPSHK